MAKIIDFRTRKVIAEDTEPQTEAEKKARDEEKIEHIERLLAELFGQEAS